MRLPKGSGMTLKKPVFQHGWIKKDLLPGQDWKFVITKEIRESRYFIALLSSKALSKRGYVHTELRTALDILKEFPKDQIYIIPVRLDKCEPLDEELRYRHWAELFPSYKKGLNEILRVLAPETINQKSKLDRRTALVALTAVIIGIVGVLAWNPIVKVITQYIHPSVSTTTIPAVSTTPAVIAATTITKPSTSTTKKLPLTSTSTTTQPVTTTTLEGKFVNSIGMEFVPIQPRPFMMGSPKDEPGQYDDELPQHRVILTNAFYMQTTEVTQEQWEALMGSNPSYFKNCGKNCPVETVSWKDVQKFIKKLNEKEGTTVYRLPTEAEWEYACRAGTTTALYNGPIKILGANHAPALDPIAWYGGNSGVSYEGGYDSSDWPEKQYESKTSGTHPVAQKQPNAYGLYDMIGNVWEWCQDWYGEYPKDAISNPKGPLSGSARVLRGGSWGSGARLCRSACRLHAPPDYRFDFLGFRLLRERL